MNAEADRQRSALLAVRDVPPASAVATGQEEYLSIADLSRRIPYATQTIRNLMSKGEFQLGVHYLKPRGRVIFKWSAVRAWMEGQRCV